MCLLLQECMKQVRQMELQLETQRQQVDAHK